jgi:hypothetical protein
MPAFLLGPRQGDPGDSGQEAEGWQEAEDWPEEDIAALKRRSVVQMERNLLEDCDSSPIQPRSITVADAGSGSCQAVEKLLMERLLLRKELRLRSMQERLLEQGERLERAEQTLQEVAALPGYRAFLWLAGAMSGLWQLSGHGSAGLARGAAGAVALARRLLLLLLLHLPLRLLHLLPPGVTIALANLAHQLSSLVAQRAQNFSNECAELSEGRGPGPGKARRAAGRRARR